MRSKGMGPEEGSLTVGSGAKNVSSGPKKSKVWGGPLRTKNGSYMAQKLRMAGGVQCCPMPWAKLHLTWLIAEETVCVLRENMTQVEYWLNQEKHCSQGLWRPS